MKKAISILLLLMVFSCATKKVGNNFTVKVTNELFESRQSRVLFDSISNRALQLRKGNTRNLDFLGNLTITNQKDTTIIEVSSELIKWEIDTSQIYSAHGAVEVLVEPVHYYLERDRKEIIQFNLYKKGDPAFKPLKYLKLIFRGQTLLFKKHIKHYRFETLKE